MHLCVVSINFTVLCLLLITLWTLNDVLQWNRWPMWCSTPTTNTWNQWRLRRPSECYSRHGYTLQIHPSLHILSYSSSCTHSQLIQFSQYTLSAAQAGLLSWRWPSKRVAHNSKTLSLLSKVPHVFTMCNTIISLLDALIVSPSSFTALYTWRYVTRHWRNSDPEWSGRWIGCHVDMNLHDIRLSC